MKLWGIGAYWDNVDMTGNFIENSYALLGWNEADAPSLHTMMNEIAIGDIIYIKSFVKSSKSLKIKAVGKIKSYLKPFKCGAQIKKGISVKWIYTDKCVIHKLSDSEMVYNVYSLTLYREYSAKIIEKLLDLI